MQRSRVPPKERKAKRGKAHRSNPVDAGRRRAAQDGASYHYDYEYYHCLRCRSCGRFECCWAYYHYCMFVRMSHHFSRHVPPCSFALLLPPIGSHRWRRPRLREEKWSSATGISRKKNTFGAYWMASREAIVSQRTPNPRMRIYASKPNASADVQDSDSEATSPRARRAHRYSRSLKRRANRYFEGKYSIGRNLGCSSKSAHCSDTNSVSFRLEHKSEIKVRCNRLRTRIIHLLTLAS